MGKIKVGILVGGTSVEREVSLESGKEFEKYLEREKYEIRKIEIPKDRSTGWVLELLQNRPDIVLSALHGGDGEDGSVQGLLECLHIPYVGAKVLGSAIGMDKHLSKQIMRMHHIPVAEDLLIRNKEELRLHIETVLRMGFPLVVKPNKGGSSIGVSIVKEMDELMQAVELAEQFQDDILIEKYIQGREVTCGLIETEKGLEVLTVLDITTEKIFYDYKAKYEHDQTRIDFSSLPHFLQVMIQEIAKKVFTVLKCSGYGRVDMIVREEQVVVLEINTLPGMTSHSLIPKAAAGMGMSYSMLLDKLIQYELQNKK